VEHPVRILVVNEDAVPAYSGASSDRCFVAVVGISGDGWIAVKPTAVGVVDGQATDSMR